MRNRFHWLLSATFGWALLCASACGVDAARPIPAAAAGHGGMGGANTGGANTGGANTGGANTGGASGSATAGLANSPGEAGTVSGAGAAGLGGGAGGGGGASGASGASTAGASATAGANANGGGSSSPCRPRSGMLACEDFETTALSTLPSGPWSVVVNGEGSVVVDGVAAHSGSKAVHVHGAGYQTLLVYHDAARLPQASGRFYVRAFVRLAEAMTSGHNTFVLADTFAAPNAGNALRLGEQNGMLMMTVGGDAHGYLSNQNYYNDHLPGVVFKPAAYSCLELLLASAQAEIQVWVEGVDVPDLHVTGLAHENYDALRFGFEKYAGPESDIWFDDIAIGTERIGCD